MSRRLGLRRYFNPCRSKHCHYEPPARFTEVLQPTLIGERFYRSRWTSTSVSVKLTTNQLLSREIRVPGLSLSGAPLFDHSRTCGTLNTTSCLGPRLGGLMGFGAAKRRLPRAARRRARPKTKARPVASSTEERGSGTSATARSFAKPSPATRPAR